MDVHRVILLLLLASSGVLGSPQRPRQSNLSSPLSMGMRFLDNIRSGMTRTFQGIFGGNNQQNNEVQQQFRQQQRPILSPPPAAPPVQVHNIETQAPSSFFTVHHDSNFPPTPFPDTQGFTDESFQPSHFFTGDSPFQGNVEEETLPFHQNTEIIPNHGGNVFHDGEHGPSFAIFQDNGTPVHGHSFPSPLPPTPAFISSIRPSVGPSIIPSIHPNIHSNIHPNIHPSIGPSVGPPIPFGNTNHFTLGSSFQGHSGQLPLAPRPTFTEEFQVREDPNQLAQPLVLGHQQPFLASRADNLKEKSTSNRKTNAPRRPITKKPKTTTPTVIVTKPTKFSSQRRTTVAAPESSTFKVIQRNSPINQYTATSRALPTTQPKELKKQTLHINTGTKLRLAPKEGDDASQDPEVSSYEFGYGVLDNDTGNQYFHAEKRQEGLTKGSYKIQLPDGRIQTVTYLADNKGFHPKITYEGEAQYPESGEVNDS